MYGYFRCSKCNSHWESAHVYPKSRGSREEVECIIPRCKWPDCSESKKKKYYKQECKACLIMCSPYRVEPTKCSICGQTARNCNCDKDRKSDPNKPHRSDLCEKCKSGSPCQF